MANRNGDWATDLGRFTRFVWGLARTIALLGGFGLLVYGIWLFDPRVAYIGGGLIILFLFWPRPDRRT